MEKEITIETSDDGMEVYINGEYIHQHSYRTEEAVMKWVEMLRNHFGFKINIVEIDEEE